MTNPAIGRLVAPVVDAAQHGSSPDQVSDIAMANAVARAVRTAPGVVDLSPGRFALAATYSSGQRITGVVVRHLTPDSVMVEVHVILSAEHCATALAQHSAEEPGVLIAIASQLREVVYRTAQDTGAPAVAEVDVFIDDMQ